MMGKPKRKWLIIFDVTKEQCNACCVVLFLLRSDISQQFREEAYNACDVFDYRLGSDLSSEIECLTRIDWRCAFVTKWAWHFCRGWLIVDSYCPLPFKYRWFFVYFLFSIFFGFQFRFSSDWESALAYIHVCKKKVISLKLNDNTSWVSFYFVFVAINKCYQYDYKVCSSWRFYGTLGLNLYLIWAFFLNKNFPKLNYLWTSNFHHSTIFGGIIHGVFLDKM